MKGPRLAPHRAWLLGVVGAAALGCAGRDEPGTDADVRADVGADAETDRRADGEDARDAANVRDADPGEDVDLDATSDPCEPAPTDLVVSSLSQIDVIGGAPIYPDIEVTADGLPVVVYTRGTNTTRYPAVSRYDGAGWSEPEAVDRREGSFLGKRPSLAIDEAGGLHVVAYDEDEGRLRYATDAAGEWTVEPLYEESADAGDHSSLAIDASGTLHVTFLRYRDYWIIYGVNEAGGWRFEPIGSRGSPPERGASSSLALDSLGRPHVAIYAGDGPGLLRYAYDPGTGWLVEDVDAMPDVGHYPTIVLDSADLPHIAYLRWPAASSEVRVAHGPGPWTVDTVDTGLGITYTTGIGLLACDAIAVAYARNEGEAPQGLWLAHAAPGEWSWTVISVDDSTYVSGIDLAVDREGGIHIVYLDETSYVLRYAELRPSGSS